MDTAVFEHKLVYSIRLKCKRLAQGTNDADIESVTAQAELFVDYPRENWQCKCPVFVAHGKECIGGVFCIFVDTNWQPNGFVDDVIIIPLDNVIGNSLHRLDFLLNVRFVIVVERLRSKLEFLKVIFSFDLAFLLFVSKVVYVIAKIDFLKCKSLTLYKLVQIFDCNHTSDQLVAVLGLMDQILNQLLELQL